MIFKFLEILKQAGCRIRDVYHVYCPCCGGTRSVEALLNLHFLQSLYYNPIVVLIIVDIITVFFLRILPKNNLHREPHYKIKIILNSAILIIWLIFSLMRNILLIFFQIDMLGDFN